MQAPSMQTRLKIRLDFISEKNVLPQLVLSGCSSNHYINKKVLQVQVNISLVKIAIQTELHNLLHL